MLPGEDARLYVTHEGGSDCNRRTHTYSIPLFFNTVAVQIRTLVIAFRRLANNVFSVWLGRVDLRRRRRRRVRENV